MSLQGEGLLVGTPSTFVRVSGCNLRCTWCDSPATSWSPRHTTTPLGELVEYCREGPPHVVVTGGEPLLFPAVAQLCARLVDAGLHVTVETAGTVWLDDLSCDLMSISPKLGHSTPHGRDESWARRHERLRRQPAVIGRLMGAFPWQLKPVVRAHDRAALAADVDEVEVLITELGVPRAARERVLLMPECVDPGRLHLDYANLVEVCRTRGFRLGERLHIALFGHTAGT